MSTSTSANMPPGMPGMRMAIIALCGVRGAGKDAIADVLCREAGFVNLKFAAPLKQALRDLFGLDEAHVDGHLKDVVHPRWGVSPRLLMQWFGTDVMQHGLARVAPAVGRAFWADKLRRRLACLARGMDLDVDVAEAAACAPGEEAAPKLPLPQPQPLPPCCCVVISDLRFQHELDMLREHFGPMLTAVRVVRPGMDAPDAHESERLVDAVGPIDHTILNDASLEELACRARLLLRKCRPSQ
jgi:hypothetical protein